MNILYAVSESAPFIKTGGLGDVAGALPQAIKRKGIACAVILPLYEDIAVSYKEKMEFISTVYVPVGWRNQYAGLFLYKKSGVNYYFIDNEYYFKRPGIYGYYDDAERFAFFSRAILELLPFLEESPDVIHCNDWQTALVPVYLDLFYRGDEKYTNIKTVFTIHNIAYQGKYDKFLLNEILGIDNGALSILEYDNCINFMKGGIERANIVTTVSKTYANEIMDPYFAHSLERILQGRAYKVRGIVNGIDTKLFDPQKDKNLPYNYNLQTLENKEKNKQELLYELGLEYKKDTPVVAMITRLANHKGIDLVRAVIGDIISRDIIFVVLGQGEKEYEYMLQNAQRSAPGKVCAYIGFSGGLANRIYAGADLFLMPSQSEPCGLSQMMAMRYGTIPIVRETGGLKDTVIPYNPETGTGTGVTFQSYNAYDMLNAIDRAIDFYRDKKIRNSLINRCMTADFSWKSAANEYIGIYKEL